MYIKNTFVKSKYYIYTYDVVSAAMPCHASVAVLSPGGQHGRWNFRCAAAPLRHGDGAAAVRSRSGSGGPQGEVGQWLVKRWKNPLDD